MFACQRLLFRASAHCVVAARRFGEDDFLMASKRLAAAALMLGAGLAMRRPDCTSCDEPRGHEVRAASYNVLSPPLSRSSHYPNNRPEDCDPERRLPKILKRLDDMVGREMVIGLQEIDLMWAGKMHTYFAERDYCVVFAQYGSQFSGYMGVMLAWPRKLYEALDVEISRVTDTAAPSVWKEGPPETLARFGFLTFQGLKQVLGCAPPSFSGDDVDEWKMARGRMNEAIFVKLRPRGGCQTPFVVSTYHMPCLFGSSTKIRVMNIHLYLLLSRLHKFANGDPALLLGDFNIKPDSSSYTFARSGGRWDSINAWPDEARGLPERLPGAAMPDCANLESAYLAFHGKEPLFTNYAKSAGMTEAFCETLDYIWYTPGGLAVIDCPALPQSRSEVDGPFPSHNEPSDHMPLFATFQLK